MIKNPDYNVNKYTDNELYEILDLVNPTDRELECKIIQMMKRYDEIGCAELSLFFKNIYGHFFLVEDNDHDAAEPEEITEEMTMMTIPPGIYSTPAQQQPPMTTIPPVPIPSPPAAPAATTNNPITTTTLPYTKDYINPILKQTMKRVISIDSQYRSFSVDPISTNFTFNLSEPLRDVLSLSLYSVHIPYTWYTISNSYGSNFIYLKANAEGITDGNYDYKISIPVGNYSATTLITALNDSITTLKNTYTDISFGQTAFEYNSTTSLTTFNVDITNLYNENKYILNFPPDEPTLQEFIGFADVSYNINTIYSKRLGVIYTGNTNIYVLDNSNNYFNIVLYDGTTSTSVYSPDLSLNTLKIPIVDLSGSPLIGNYNITQLVSYINNTLQNSTYTDNAMPNGFSYNSIGTGFFQMSIYLNKKTTYNDYSVKTAVLFPDESGFASTRNRVWFDASGNTTYNSCAFKFPNLTNELCFLTSENISLQSNYIIDDSPTLLFTSNSSYYDISFQSVLPASPAIGYSLQEYINAIQTSIDTLNADTISSGGDIPPLIPTPKNSLGYFNNTTVQETNDLATFQFNINLEFTEKYFGMDISNTDCYYGNSVVFDETSATLGNVSGTSPIYNTTHTGTVGNITTLSGNICVNPNSYYYTTALDNLLELTLTGMDITPAGNIVISNDLSSNIVANDGLGNVVVLNGTQQIEGNLITDGTTYSGNLWIHGNVNLDSGNTTININGSTPVVNANTILYNYTVPVSGTITTNVNVDIVVSGDVSVNYSPTIEVPFLYSTDLSYNNIFTYTLYKPNFNLDDATTTLMYINPKTIAGYTGTTVKPWKITPPANINLKTVSNVYDHLSRFQAALNTFTDDDGSQPLSNATLALLTETAITAKIQMTLNVDKNLSTQNFDVSFIDASNNSWYDFLKIPLAYYDLSGVPNYTITSSDNVYSNTITFTNDTYLKLSPNPLAAGLYVDYDLSYNEYIINIPANTYTRQQLFNVINTQFTNNAVLNGSRIYTNTSGNDYVNFRFNINRAYTSADYNVVFYDVYSFVKCYVGASSVRNVAWDDTLGWILGFRGQTIYTIAADVSANPAPNTNIYSLVGDTTYTKSFYNYFLIQLDDYTQSHLNDGLVTITNTDNTVSLPSYASQRNLGCNQSTGLTEFLGTTQTGQNKLTRNQIYAAQQILNQQQTNQTNQINISKGPYAQDIFGFIPVKTTGLSVGDTFTDSSGPLQNQQRVYFGPVNIRRMTIRLLNDKGDVLDLNGSNWSFSFVCEQLYQQGTI